MRRTRDDFLVMVPEIDIAGRFIQILCGAVYDDLKRHERVAEFESIGFVDQVKQSCIPLMLDERHLILLTKLYRNSCQSASILNFIKNIGDDDIKNPGTDVAMS